MYEQRLPIEEWKAKKQAELKETIALKGHDASQRAQGFMTFFGGVVIYFAKDILDMIL